MPVVVSDRKNKGLHFRTAHSCFDHIHKHEGLPHTASAAEQDKEMCLEFESDLKKNAETNKLLDCSPMVGPT